MSLRQRQEIQVLLWAAGGVGAPYLCCCSRRPRENEGHGAGAPSTCYAGEAEASSGEASENCVYQ